MAVVRLMLQLLLCAAAPVAAAPTGSAHLPGTVSGRFWHITDLHLDPTYHLAPDPTKVCFSSKGAPARDAGVFGDFLCDSPYSLIRSALANMASLVQPHDFIVWTGDIFIKKVIRSALANMAQLVEPHDFIVWTGDSPPHVPPEELSTELVIQVIRNMTQTIRQQFPNLTVYPALGNHDYWPQDQMETSSNAIYKAAAELWADWLQPDALLTLSNGGFYSQLVKPGLRVVSLNTILYYGPNKVTANMSDPAGQYEWLEKTLEQAAHNMEKIYIIAHVPVGYLPFVKNITAIREGHNERLVAIFRKHSHVIAGHFYGHTHRDSVMVLLDKTGKPVNSLFVSPAVTPIKSALEPYSNNPGFRMYKYDVENFAVLDIWQYYLNLTEANEKQRSDWRLEYIMTEAFGLSDLQPRSLLQLGLSLRLPQTRAFDRYFSHFMVSYSSDVRCQGQCRLQQVCAVLYLDRLSYDRCVAKGP